VNQRHVTEEKLDEAITEVVNAYNKFALPKLWGTGKSASADVTKWDLYEDNLLSEYHIRYGGYGGIGYYHVSDMYIALFSHFISLWCLGGGKDAWSSFRLLPCSRLLTISRQRACAAAPRAKSRRR
jgi:hypothetical protein